MLLSFLCGFLVSATLTVLVIRWWHTHLPSAADHDLLGCQKVHREPVPRIGGAGIAVGLFAATLLTLPMHRPEAAELGLLLLVCALPAFASGLGEDITKRVRPRTRLWATVVSGALAVWLLDAVITRTDLWGLDWIASFALGAAFLAVFTVTGISHAINIIDGFNGLASMCVVFMLMAIAYVALEVGDAPIAALALAGAGAVLGFFVWNYPGGRIFLGDGGAYLLGFYLAELGILLLQRNPEVSPLFPLLMAIYPVFETLFSMYRRRIVRGGAIVMPDGVHLHSLVYRRLLHWTVGHDEHLIKKRNSMTAPYLWLLCMASVLPAVLFWDQSHVLAGFILLFVLSYVLLYSKIVRFRVPRWLVLRR